MTAAGPAVLFLHKSNTHTHTHTPHTTHTQTHTATTNTQTLTHSLTQTHAHRAVFSAKLKHKHTLTETCNTPNNHIQKYAHCDHHTDYPHHHHPHPDDHRVKSAQWAGRDRGLSVYQQQPVTRC